MQLTVKILHKVETFQRQESLRNKDVKARLVKNSAKTM